MNKSKAIILAKKAISVYYKKGMPADAIFWEEILMAILEKKFIVKIKAK